VQYRTLPSLCALSQVLLAMAAPHLLVVVLHSKPCAMSQSIVTEQLAPAPARAAQAPPAHCKVLRQGRSAPQASSVLPQVAHTPLSEQPSPAMQWTESTHGCPGAASAAHVPHESATLANVQSLVAHWRSRKHDAPSVRFPGMRQAAPGNSDGSLIHSVHDSDDHPAEQLASAAVVHPVSLSAMRIVLQ
jgi:hypothetical protein